MRRFFLNLTAASGLIAATAGSATTLLGFDPKYAVDPAFLQALGVDDVGDAAGAPPQINADFGPRAGTAADGGLTDPIDPTVFGFADSIAPASSNSMNNILGADVFGGIFSADQPSSQTLVEIQEFDSAPYVLDRLGSSFAQALGGNKR